MDDVLKTAKMADEAGANARYMDEMITLDMLRALRGDRVPEYLNLL